VLTASSSEFCCNAAAAVVGCASKSSAALVFAACCNWTLQCSYSQLCLCQQPLYTVSNVCMQWRRSLRHVQALWQHFFCQYMSGGSTSTPCVGFWSLEPPSHNLSLLPNPCRFSAVSGRQLLKEGDMNAAADKVARTQYDLNSDNVAR
jgi:hypothetical protein